jgi:GWxTD domain-containing protein
MKRVFYTLAFLFFCYFQLSGCSASRENLIDPGTAHAFRTGFPEVKARVSGFFDEQSSPVVDVHAEISHSSLIFTSIDGSRQARIQIDGYLRKSDDSLELVQRFSQEFTIRPSEESERSNSLIFERRLQVPAGVYELDFLVKDLTSDKTSSLKLFVRVAAPVSRQADLTDIRISSLVEDRQSVVTSFLIPATSDSLFFSFFAVKPDNETPVTVTSRLLEIRSDREIPRPMSHMPITTGSLAYQGVDYSTLTEINSWSSTIEQPGIKPLYISGSKPNQGVYRFEVTISNTESDGTDSEVRRFRDFSIVSPNFPEIKTQREMIPPLSYLMDRREFQRISSIEEPDSLRRAFEQFWLRNTRNRNTARDVIQLYYSRVEEANRIFTGFREGWMTDMGMVYILLGPPVHIENTIDSMTWHYGFDRMDPRTIFRFERARVPGASFPFQHYVLVRNRFYHDVEHTIIQDWLTGRILIRGGL